MSYFRRINDAYMNLFTNYGFRHVFYYSKKKNIIQDLMNCLLPDQHQLIDFEYCSDSASEKIVHSVDPMINIVGQTSNGERILIEFQIERFNRFGKWENYIESFQRIGQLKQSGIPKDISHVYAIGALNFDFSGFRSNDPACTITWQQGKEAILKPLTHIFVFLSAFDKHIDELESTRDKWFYVLKNLGRLDERPKSFHERVFMDLFEVADVSALSEDDYLGYERSAMAFRDMLNVINTARMEGINEARREQGLAKTNAD